MLLDNLHHFSLSPWASKWQQVISHTCPFLRIDFLQSATEGWRDLTQGQRHHFDDWNLQLTTTYPLNQWLKYQPIFEKYWSYLWFTNIKLLTINDWSLNIISFQPYCQLMAGFFLPLPSPRSNVEGWCSATWPIHCWSAPRVSHVERWDALRPWVNIYYNGMDAWMRN